MSTPILNTGTGLPDWLRELALPLHIRSAPDACVESYPLRDLDALRAHIPVALPITFTPYAAVQPCSARCVFCSENLRVEGSLRHASQLRPQAGYFEGLSRALHALGALPIGVSLSGLEATDNVDWLLTLLQTLRRHERVAGHPYTEKILYTNGSGFGAAHTRRLILNGLVDFGLERVEWSRHSDRQAENDRIMRFRPEIGITANAVFEASIRPLREAVPVTLVCVLQQGGVDSPARVEEYLSWANRLGIERVVFREFARPADHYRLNNTLIALQRSRVACETLIKPLFESPEGAMFEPLAVTEGYYFWNAEFRWRDRLQVVFEASDYQRMHERHASDVVYKLIYHANGHLTADWDPHTRILLKT